jgi:hypothetical protein
MDEVLIRDNVGFSLYCPFYFHLWNLFFLRVSLTEVDRHQSVGH